MKLLKKVSYYLAAILCMGIVTVAANELHPDAYATVDCSTEYHDSAKIAKCGSCKVQFSNDSDVRDCVDGTNQSGTGDLYTDLRTIINWVTMIVGILAVIMIIYGGVMMMISMGDPGRNKKARDTILYGIIGLIIVLLAYAIVNFILNILQ